METIHRHKTDGVTRIVQLVRERGIRTLVLGIPVRMDGTEGTAAAKVRASAGNWPPPFPAFPWYSWMNASPPSSPRKNCTPPAKRRKSFRPIIDQVAAVEILNTWLDSTLG
ncbi:MAG: Holliday junction resolvase RuvX [Akkermansia sp.]